MTQNSELVLNYLKTNFGREFSKQQLVEALGISLPSVTGTINALVKKGYVENTHEETIELVPATETRKAQVKNVLYHTLTEAGLSYDPAVEEAEKLAAKEAAKKAEKEAAKAAKAAAKKVD